MKILIALDDSPHSERALEFVTRMRWPAGSRVIVATVMRPMRSDVARLGGSARAGPVGPGREQRTCHEAVVTRAQGRLRAAGLATELRIAEGDPREQLERLIESERANLLVMGSRGRTGIVQLVLGSVSSHAVGHARSSVLVVKQPVEGLTQQPKEDAMKILVGVDDSPHSKAAVDFVRRMTWPKNTKVVVISVVQPAVSAPTEIYVPAPSSLDLQEELVRIHESIALNAESSLRGGGLGTEARVLRGDPRVTLVEAARTERADLIVVGSHGRTGIAKLFMGSVASHVVTHAPCSVLVVKLENR